MTDPMLGKRFSRLTILALTQSKNKRKYYLAQCDCGNKKIVMGKYLRNNDVRSCGCLKEESCRATARKRKIHGKCRLFNIWKSMCDRCHKHYSPNYKNYGARGIFVCKDWRDNYLLFENWALKNGYTDYYQIDRINNEDGYYPENCRWVTPSTNSRNRRSTRYALYNGEKLPLISLVEKYSINASYPTVLARLGRGWDLNKALKTPVLQWGVGAYAKN